MVTVGVVMKFFKKLLWKLSVMNDAIITAPVALEKEFCAEIRKRKEQNSQAVWSAYYIPLATAAIVREQGNITNKDVFKLECLANSLMFKDMADGKLNEFYQFVKE